MREKVLANLIKQKQKESIGRKWCKVRNDRRELTTETKEIKTHTCMHVHMHAQTHAQDCFAELYSNKFENLDRYILPN